MQTKDLGKFEGTVEQMKSQIAELKQELLALEA